MPKDPNTQERRAIGPLQTMQGTESFQRWKSCTRKKAFATAGAAAQQKGQEVYRCRYCGKWHRTSGIAKLAAQVRRNEKGNN